MGLLYTNIEKNKTVFMVDEKKYKTFLKKDLSLRKDDLDRILNTVNNNGVYYGAFFKIIKHNTTPGTIEVKITEKKHTKTWRSYWKIKNNNTNKIIKICNLNQFFRLINLTEKECSQIRTKIYFNDGTASIKHFTITRVTGDNSSLMRVL